MKIELIKQNGIVVESIKQKAIRVKLIKQKELRSGLRLCIFSAGPRYKCVFMDGNFEVAVWDAKDRNEAERFYAQNNTIS